MMPVSVAPSDLRFRCRDVDVDGGICQLLVRHAGPHASAVEGAYLTWDRGDVHRWAMMRPPSWLVQLPWAPGFQPHIVRDENDLPNAVGD
jgi:hypothetical protein